MKIFKQIRKIKHLEGRIELLTEAFEAQRELLQDLINQNFEHKTKKEIKEDWNGGDRIVKKNIITLRK